MIPIEETDSPKINENQILKTEPPDIPEEPRIKLPLISSPDNDLDDVINDISPTDNISPIKTLNELQKSVEKNDKPVSIVLFYGPYCPYSKRTIPELRQWARTNQDRIFLYEVDVEQASNLAEYYHVRSIPTIMAFEDNNLIAPIWQRSATNILSSSIVEESKPMEEVFDDVDSIPQESDRIESVHDIKQNQTLSETKIDTRSKSSVDSPYIWNKSTQSIETNSRKSSEESFSEYNGRMISQSTISKSDQLKSKSFYELIFLNKFRFKKKNANGVNISILFPNLSTIHSIFIYPIVMKFFTKNNSIIPTISIPHSPPIDLVH